MTRAPKKKTVAESPADLPDSQDNLNHLYMAHQVHTLAQLVFQQLALGWQSRAQSIGAQAPGPMRAQSPGAPAWNAAMPVANTMHGPAPHPAGHPALFYWYP